MKHTIDGRRRARYCVPPAFQIARNSVPYAATLLLLIGGCATSSPQPLATSGQGQLVVICLIARGVDEAAVVPAANALAKMHDVLDVRAATGVPGEFSQNAYEPALGRHIAFVITFKSGAAAVKASKDCEMVLHDNGYDDSKIDRVIISAGTLQNYLVSETYSNETTAADLQRRAAAIKQQNELRGQTK